MFQVLYRLQGAGLWSPWFLPSTAQAASGQVGNLQRNDRVVAVRVAPSGAPAAGVDVKV